MKAIRFHELGEPEVLKLEELPTPTPGAGEVLVRVRAAGMNFADTRFRRGEYFTKAVFPQIPGMEAAGDVVALGAGAEGVQEGDRVMVLGGTGAYAEYLTCKPYNLYPMPEALDYAEAASLPVQGLTAQHVLALFGRLQRGERVLVHAAAGGVGVLAVQLAKRMGASMVIATAGSPEKLELAKTLGADVVINYRTEDVLKAVRHATGGEGVDVLLEMIGGTDHLKANLRSMAPFGRMIVYGAAGGDTHGTVEPISLMLKNQSILGYYLTPILRQRELCAPVLEELAQDVVTGRLKVLIGKRYPLAEAVEAHRAMERRDTVGKLVLVP